MIPGLTDPGATPAETSTARKRPVRRRRWRLTIRLLVFVPLALVLVVLLLARSPMVRNGIAEQLVELTGADVRMRKAKIDVTGRIIARDLVLTVPGLSGPAAEIVTARKVEIDLDWSGVFSWSGLGTPRPTAVRLYNPVFRLSQSFDDGSLNFGGLAQRGGGGVGGGTTGGARTGLTPTIDIFDGRIEFGEHSVRLERYELLNAIQVAGSMIAERDGSYIVKMQEIGRVSPPRGVAATFPRGMILAGNIHLARAEASLKLLNLPLEAWPPEAVPTAFRDLWRRLSIQGRIRETVFSFDRASGVRLSVAPEDVSMDILIPAERGGDIPGDLSLAHVNGMIELSRAGLHADLQGVFEDQTSPARVVLKTEGTSLNSALTCEISADGLTVARNPGFLPYVPAAAREHFEFFSGPTGEVDARVTIARGPPVNGEAAPIVVTDGRLTVRNGTAAFHRFPYPFESMEGRAVFDDRRINILDMTGVGPTGARLRASAQISPLTDDAEANVSISVTGVPVDEHLRKAMPGERARIFEVLFNEERHAALLRAGLVRIPDAPEAPEPGAGDVPEFAFGGLADIEVKVHRPLGHNVDWKTDVVVRFAEAGIVPEPFPFPIRARDVELKITDDDAVLTRGTFAGLRGGRAELAAHIVLRENGVHVIKPTVRIDAFGVPVDDRLIHAVPEDRDRTEAEETVSAKAILRRLAIEGNVDCTAIIEDDGRGEGDVDYDVVVKMAGLEARPRTTAVGGAGRGEVRVTGVSGSVRVTPVEVRVESLVGTLVERPLGDGEEGTCGAFTLDLSAQLIPPEDDEGSTRSGPLTARAELRDLSLGAPLEPLLAVFNDDAAELVARTRARREPEGKLNAGLRIDIADSAASARVLVAFSEFRDVSFRALQGRLTLSDVRGTATLGDEPQGEGDDRRRAARVAFDQFAATLGYHGDPAGSVSLNGGFLFDPEAEEGTPFESLIADADLRIELRDAALESAFVADMLAEGLEPATVERFDAIDAAGRFDAHIDLRGEPAVASGLIGPRSLSFMRHGQRITIPAMHGHVRFATNPPGGENPARTITGSVETLGCIASDWSAAADGEWTYIPGRGVEAALSLSVRGDRLTDDLLAMLPGDIGEGARSLGLTIGSGFSMPEASLALSLADDDPAGERTGVVFEGAMRFMGAAADLGVAIGEAEGEAFVRAEQKPGRPAEIEAELRVPRLSVAGLAMTGGRIELATALDVGPDGAERSTISITHASAACHEGRVWATAQIGPPATEGAGREYSVDVLGAGVQFAPVLDELGGEEAATSEQAAAEDRTRGMVDAWVSVAGRAGDPSSRMGRGAVRVANGDVLRLPVMLPLVQMSNLMLPKSDRFDYLQAEFNLRGAVAEFERIAVLSDSVSLMGAGTVTLPGFGLDMRFNSRANHRLPLLSDLYEAVRDEIVTTRVSGTVAEPEIRSESFSTARTVLGMLMDPSHERAGEIVRDRAARREQARTSRAAQATPPLPPTTLPAAAAGVDG